MSIYKGSRFEGSFIYNDEDNPDIAFLSPFREVKYFPDKSDYLYEVRQGDRIDIIANRFYGNPKLDWVILDANPNLKSPLSIKTGMIIRVPVRDRVDEA